MYSAYGFRAAEIGDVDILWHDDLFHLFHLVLPNHDYIAHAVSEDGLAWRRVRNALFISDPGAWDDDMLWTMHVTPDPHRPGSWRMFYTGLQLREHGLVQRIGLARSDDLYTWEKAEGAGWPLEVPGDHYESTLDEGRKWVSFRDPYYFRHEGRGYLLAAARSKQGPVIRRGCVALAEETSPDVFEFGAPLFHPHRYDDIEVPCLFHENGRFYLFGSIREDVKVHYWLADHLFGPFRNFSDNVILPQGNYAARVCRCDDGDRLLVWNYFRRGAGKRGDHLLPPPKEIEADRSGELRLRSYRGFDDKVTGVRSLRELAPFEPLLGTAKAECHEASDRWRIGSGSGFEVFALRGSHDNFRLAGNMEVGSSGKLGFALHLTEHGDGYYISLDLTKGIAQIRFWAENPGGDFESAFEYDQFQAGHFVPRPGPVPFMLLAYGTYVELSLYGEVVLTVADQRRIDGRVGFYLESCSVDVSGLRLETLKMPHPRAGTQDPASRGAAGGTGSRGLAT